MAVKKLVYYGAIALAILIVLSIVISVVSAILSLAWAAVSAIISLAILLGILYVAYKAGVWLFGGDDGADVATDGYGVGQSSSTSTDETLSAADRLRTQYVEGQITEDEFEERLQRHLESEAVASESLESDPDLDLDLDRR